VPDDRSLGEKDRRLPARTSPTSGRRRLRHDKSRGDSRRQHRYERAPAKNGRETASSVPRSLPVPVLVRRAGHRGADGEGPLQTRSLAVRGQSPPWPLSTEATAGNAEGFPGRRRPHPPADHFFHGLLEGRRHAPLLRPGGNSFCLRGVSHVSSQ
jgi:hypothetical protein